MGGLNLHAEETPAPKKRNRSPKVILGAVLLLLIPAVGSTLAANISINSNASVQFGQGVTATTGCDSAITITPAALYSPGNGATNGTFNLDTITVDDLDLTKTGASGCAGRTLSFSVYDAGTPQVLQNPISGYGIVSFALPSSNGTNFTSTSAGSLSPASGFTVSLYDCTGSGTTCTALSSSNGGAYGRAVIVFSSPSLAAANVGHITIQSS